MKNVLITGGSGFVARGFVREAMNRGATRICIYSRGEFAQHLMREEFKDDYRLRWFIGDVRDSERLQRAMHGVDTVIAAAALKRIETAHYNPDEVVKTNVIGIMNTIESAQRAGARKMVLVSTDKAANPCSVYGQSKAMAEALVMAANNTTGEGGTSFSVCRFGNVWGSTGSIVPKWRALIAAGAIRVPVTDPSCTRYFMRQTEAANLIYKTAIDMTGKIVTPDLPAYSIGDLAQAMVVSMDVCGLPAFEKHHETMDGVTTSQSARRMTVEELRKELQNV